MHLGDQLQFNANRRDDVSIVPLFNADRFQHCWVIGKTGVGKSTALERWIVDDISQGAGVAFFDPHGDAADMVLRHVPPRRRGDVILFDPSDREFPIAFNMLANVPIERRAFVASSVVDCFKSIWGHSWGPQLELFLYAGTRALLDVPDGTLMGLKFLMTSARYRARVISHCRDPAIRDFWLTDFAEHMPEREQRERTLSTLNKIGALIADPAIRNAIGQSKCKLDLQAIMDQGQVLIVRLPQGQLGIEKAALIGALLMSHLHLAALSRKTRRPFHVYADECHHFGSGALVEMLSGIRKFGVSLVLAHQYLDQLSPALQSALIGTVGTLVAFRLGVTDFQRLAPELGLDPESDALTALPAYHAYIRSAGVGSTLTMPRTHQREYPSAPRRIRNRCRTELASRLAKIEKRINQFILSA